MKKVLCFVTTFAILAVSVFAFTSPTKALANNADTVYADISAYGGTPLDYIFERIDYGYTIEDNYYNSYKLPGYLSSYTCGISAGGNVFGHYDRIYPELIPNHQGRIFLGKYLYGTQGDEVYSMFDQLYAGMNATPEGVTIDGYKNGVRSYATSKGRTATFTPAMQSANELNINQYKQAIRDGKLLTIFADGYNFILDYDFERHDNYDYFTIYRNAGAHVMIAYGFRDIAYYNNDNQFICRDLYLNIATGVSSPLLAFIRINDYCTIDDGYITEVY